MVSQEAIDNCDCFNQAGKLIIFEMMNEDTSRIKASLINCKIYGLLRDTCVIWPVVPDQD